jgi:hypothetical protein
VLVVRETAAVTKSTRRQYLQICSQDTSTSRKVPSELLISLVPHYFARPHARFLLTQLRKHRRPACGSHACFVFCELRSKQQAPQQATSNTLGRIDVWMSKVRFGKRCILLFLCQLPRFVFLHPGHLCLRAIIHCKILPLVLTLSHTIRCIICHSPSAGGRSTMADQNAELDNDRYQHHLEHRGKANQHIFLFTWIFITSVVIVLSIRRTSEWWSRRQ